MIEIRCTNCSRLLYVQNGCVKSIRTNDKITYNVRGSIEITCKCGTLNK